MRRAFGMAVVAAGIAWWTACGSSSSTSGGGGADGGGSSSSGASGTSSGSSGSSSGSSGSSGASGAPACGVTTYGADYPAGCQSALDQACCNESKACAASADCVRIVMCINACARPRQDSCVNACTGADAAAPGIAELQAIGDCSKNAPFPGSLDAGACDWP